MNMKNENALGVITQVHFEVTAKWSSWRGQAKEKKIRSPIGEFTFRKFISGTLHIWKPVSSKWISAVVPMSLPITVFLVNDCLLEKYGIFGLINVCF